MAWQKAPDQQSTVISIGQQADWPWPQAFAD
jgi:hypothetical protein